ncbi:MAG: DUF3429 domain-containing protein [Pseudomonadota bacterium]
MYRLRTPQAPLALTTAGLIPFVALAGLTLLYRDDPALMQAAGVWLITYGAIILTFLGGIRWGLEIAQRDKPRFIELGGSIVSPIVSWGLILLFFFWRPSALIFMMLAASFLIFWFWDFASTRLPSWYQRLRIWPTLGAVLSLGVAAWAF